MKRFLISLVTALSALEGWKSAKFLMSSWGGRGMGFWVLNTANGDRLKGLSMPPSGLGRAGPSCNVDAHACGNGDVVARTRL